MAVGAGKCSKIRLIVRLQQMVRQWRQKAAASRRCVPPDVPLGHVAVSVGRSGRRFIIRATHLNHPIFRKLLVQVEEELGFVNQRGPLSIPCDELLFQDILHFLNRSNLHDKFCHISLRESRPLLPHKSVS